MNQQARQIKSQHTLRLSQLQLLVNVRWLFVGVQVLALAVATIGFSIQLTLLAFIPLIMLELLVNVSTQVAIQQKRLISRRIIWYQLLIDLSCSSVLLYFSGGATNALVSLLLIPVTMSGLLCSKFRAWLTCALAIMSYSFLLFYFQPLEPADHHAHISQWHYLGMWLTFVFSSILLVASISRLTQILDQQRQQVEQLSHQQSVDEQVVAIANLSANAAHRLATPLNTMQLLAEELTEEKSSKAIAEQLLEQINRSIEQLRAIRHAAEIDHDNQQMLVQNFIQQLKYQWQLLYPELSLAISTTPPSMQSLYLASPAQLFPAIINLIENAARENQNSNEKSTPLTFSVENNCLVISLTNTYKLDGINENLPRPNILPQKSKGLGVGFYLANASIQKLGGKVELRLLNGQVTTTIELPVSHSSTNPTQLFASGVQDNE